MYGRNLLVAHTMSRHSLSVVEYVFSAFVRVLEAYAITSSRHYSEFVLGQLRYRTRLHQYGFLYLSSYIPKLDPNRDSVGSLVDWSMITSKNPVFHIRLRGCRLVGLREKPRKFPELNSLFLCSSGLT
ncbi:hypothetical protein TNCV_1755411 [Trichonephila clavipes]|nr:hypothetical protein TNCV_1755411 [Trichonephila clavipes]